MTNYLLKSKVYCNKLEHIRWNTLYAVKCKAVKKTEHFFVLLFLFFSSHEKWHEKSFWEKFFIRRGKKKKKKKIRSNSSWFPIPQEISPLKGETESISIELVGYFKTNTQTVENGEK